MSSTDIKDDTSETRRDQGAVPLRVYKSFSSVPWCQGD